MRTLLALAVLAILVVHPSDAAAQSAGNGLQEQSVNSFVFDPTRGVVSVTIDITLRNVTSDQVSGGVVTTFFWDSYGVVVPTGAENIVATRNGAVLSGELRTDPAFPAFANYEFDLGGRLQSGQSTTLQVTYDHLGTEPRDPSPWRVNEAYAGFAAFGLGDPGLITLRIALPDGYEFDEFTDLSGFDAGVPDEFGTVVYTRSELTEDVTVIVGMSNNDRLVSRTLDVDGVDIELRSWPDDPVWADFAADRVESGIPALEELIGTSWPVDGSFDVRQSVEPYLAGYAGWFDLASSEIAVGEELDADLIYHELSHAWFNGSMSDQRWLNEGLAQVYAAELVRQDGEEFAAPNAPSPDDPSALPLAEWNDPDFDLDDLETPRDVEEYGYNASFWVLDQLIDDIGFERNAEVVGALRGGTSPYGGDGAVQVPSEAWQRTYDLFVEIGGSADAHELFTTHVVATDDAALIAARDEIAAEAALLTERSTPWPLPLGVRNTMEQWRFDDADEAIAAADEVLELRAVLEMLEATVGIDDPDRAGDAYAGAPFRADSGLDLSEPISILDEAIALGEDVQARQQQILDVADTAGVTPPELDGVASVDDFVSALAEADDQLEALERFAEVHDRLSDASGILATVGRWGSDVERSLADARAEFESGDNGAALVSLDAAAQQIDDLAADGAVRLGVAAAVVVLLALIVVAMLLLRRRGRRAGSGNSGTPPV